LGGGPGFLGKPAASMATAATDAIRRSVASASRRIRCFSGLSAIVEAWAVAAIAVARSGRACSALVPVRGLDSPSPCFGQRQGSTSNVHSGKQISASSNAQISFTGIFAESLP